MEVVRWDGVCPLGWSLSAGIECSWICSLRWSSAGFCPLGLSPVGLCPLEFCEYSFRGRVPSLQERKLEVVSTHHSVPHHMFADDTELYKSDSPSKAFTLYWMVSV